tara:strand:- start:353 stop:817 length:465 start_codon:yes stop_codon:yes gene_type:complete
MKIGKVVIKLIVAYLVFLISCIALVLPLLCDASPLSYEDDIVISTIILEAGGEYHVGALEGVYEVIMNRAEKRDLTPAEVCLQKKQFSCWNSGKIEELIAKAKEHPRWIIAQNILGRKTNYTNGADHYHADYVTPYWAKSMKKTVVIGRHIFYK